MLPFRKVLFPVDYSPQCTATIPYVQDMVRHFSAELTLVHAYALRPVFTSRDPEAILVYSDASFADPEVSEEARRTEELRLRDFAAKTFPDWRAESIAQEGEAGTVIDQVIQHQGADLVMMPTRGSGPLRRLLLGSVTAKVLHDISAAVWTGVGASIANHQPAIPYKSIVCALDASDESDEAEAVLRAAAALAESYKAKLALIHVLQTPPATPEIDFSIYRNDLIDAANAQLRDLTSRLNLDVPHTVIDAGVVDGIHHEVIRRKADLVVVGRGHDQDTFSRIWSRLYAIVRDSPCPVLSI